MRAWVWPRAGSVVVMVALLLAASGTSREAFDIAAASDRLAAPIIGASFHISANTASAKGTAAVAPNRTDGEYLVVWADRRSGWSIYGRRVGADGTPLGDDFPIVDTGAEQWAPAAAWNDQADEYLVVWQDWRNAPAEGWAIYGRRVSANGALLGDDFRISVGSGSADAWTPAVVWNTRSAEYLVVWEDWRNASTRMADIYAHRVSANGALVGSDFRVSAGGATGSELGPALAWNGARNEYLVVWEDGRRAGTRGHDVWGQRLDATGGALGSDFRISAGHAPSEVFLPEVVWNPAAAEYLVAWEDWRNAATSGSDIYCRRVASDGTLPAGDFRISEAPGKSEETRPALARDESTDGFLLVWEERRADEDWPFHYADIYGRALGSDGMPLDSPFRLSGEAGFTLSEGFPAVAHAGTGDGYLVLWTADLATQVDGRSLRRPEGRSADAQASARADEVSPEPAGGASLINPAALPDPTGDALQPLTPEEGTVRAEERSGVSVTVDVGFVYTRAARVQAGGRAAVEAWAANAVLYTNEALRRSRVEVLLRVVFIAEVDYHAYSACTMNLVNLETSSALAQARSLRDRWGADLLTLISDEGNAGQALLNGAYSQVILPRFYPGEFKPTSSANVAAHEWGHNFGAMHEQGYGECTPPGCAYNAPDHSFQTIMSYGRGCDPASPSCPSDFCPMIPNYSNPDVSFSWLDPPVLLGNPNAYDVNALANFIPGLQQGPGSQPTGVEGEADNASVMNQQAAAVASWRASVVPKGPLCSGLSPTWIGTEGDDTFRGTSERDVVLALGGDDVIYGLTGSDVICAGGGQDTVYGGADPDIVLGGEGGDRLFGETGDDVLLGEGGADRLYGESGRDVLSGGVGSDRLDGAAGEDYLHAGAGNDLLFGGADVDRLLGREGNDTLRGGRGSDYLQPGPGTDEVIETRELGQRNPLSFEDTNGPVTLTAGTFPCPQTITGANGTGTVSLTISGTGGTCNSDYVVGSRYDDRLLDWTVAYGLYGDDYLTGTVLFGAAGNDYLDGRALGWVDGGDGTDRCRGDTVMNCERPI